VTVRTIAAWLYLVLSIAVAALAGAWAASWVDSQTLEPRGERMRPNVCPALQAFRSPRAAIPSAVASRLAGARQSVAGEDPESRLAPGKFLVASRDLRDPNFLRTVVLLLRYDDHGAMGLIVNRPSELSASSLLPGVEGLAGRKAVVFQGGPVQLERLQLLIRTGRELEDADRVFADVWVSESRRLLERLAGETEDRAEFRIFAGYAGWGPGQLDHEVAAGGWHVISADPDLVFRTEPAGLWEDLLPRDPTRWVRGPARATSLRAG